jgi:hypothetical protein
MPRDLAIAFLDMPAAQSSKISLTLIILAMFINSFRYNDMQG